MSQQHPTPEECQALAGQLRAFDTLVRLRAAAAWPTLEARLRGILSTIRRHDPKGEPGAPRDPSRLRAVHWNIEHGNRYPQVESALRSHPELADADLVSLNEVDLGMARSGNRDVAAELAEALGLHAAWAPLFLETTAGRDDDARGAAGRENGEALFGIAILSRWPMGEIRIVELAGPERHQFEVERMLGRHVALIAEIRRPEAPFVAVTTHLEIHRTRHHRAVQMRLILQALGAERRPVVLGGDFNSTTLDRGRWWDAAAGAVVLGGWPEPLLRRRLRWPDRGPAREPLFQALREAGFNWERHVDRQPTLAVRAARLREARALVGSATARPLLRWIEARGQFRLDWFAGRGWSAGRGATVCGLDGLDGASDHAPLVAEFW